MKIIAVVGSYHRGGMAETAVDEILAAARDEGAEVEKIHLLDAPIEFCTNCQACAQAPGDARGKCPTADGAAAILDRLEACDAVVLASPMNFFTVTALMKRFIERLVCYAYWPWGKAAPTTRPAAKKKRGAIVVTSAAPGFLARFCTSIGRPLKAALTLFGARKIESLYVGLARHEPAATLGPRARRKARKIGRRLAGR